MVAPFKPHLARLTEIRVNRYCEFIGPEIAQIIEEAIDRYMETKQQLELDSQLAKGLQQPLDVPDADAVEDTFCLDFAQESKVDRRDGDQHLLAAAFCSGRALQRLKFAHESFAS